MKASRFRRVYSEGNPPGDRNPLPSYFYCFGEVLQRLLLKFANSRMAVQLSGLCFTKLITWLSWFTFDPSMLWDIVSYVGKKVESVGSVTASYP
jgi:hypothetical protein